MVWFNSSQYRYQDAYVFLPRINICNFGDIFLLSLQKAQGREKNRETVTSTWNSYQCLESWRRYVTEAGGVGLHFVVTFGLSAEWGLTKSVKLFA